MVFGFNTDVQIGDLVLHVQTEDRGRRCSVIDTVVYAGGHVVYRRKRSYAEHLDDPAFHDEVLRGWLEEQHRAVIEELRSGSLPVHAPPHALPPTPDAPPAPPPAGAVTAPAAPAPPQLPGIRVQLLNPGSWLNAGSASLQIEVHSRLLKQPVAEAQVEVVFEGAQRAVQYMAITDAVGRVEMSFPVPRPGPGGAQLIIRAVSPAGEDEIRYSLRPKAKPSAP
jgi:hypothetical protein